jgi:hypothetical protein
MKSMRQPSVHDESSGALPGRSSGSGSSHPHPFPAIASGFPCADSPLHSVGHAADFHHLPDSPSGTPEGTWSSSLLARLLWRCQSNRGLKQPSVTGWALRALGYARTVARALNGPVADKPAPSLISMSFAVTRPEPAQPVTSPLRAPEGYLMRTFLDKTAPTRPPSLPFQGEPRSEAEIPLGPKGRRGNRLNLIRVIPA